MSGSDPSVASSCSFWPGARRRFSEPDALPRYQDFHGQLEPQLQRQNEHGVVGRSARAVSRSRTGGIRGLECSAASEAQRLFPADDEIYFPQGDARHSAARSAKATEGRICRSGGLLAGERFERDGGRLAFGIAGSGARAVPARGGAHAGRGAPQRARRTGRCRSGNS